MEALKTDTGQSDLERAQELIQAQRKKIVDVATSELVGFVNEWSAKHGVYLSPQVKITGEGTHSVDLLIKIADKNK